MKKQTSPIACRRAVLALNSLGKAPLTILSAIAATSFSNAALLLTFTEESGNVVMRTSGSVDVGDSWSNDAHTHGEGSTFTFQDGVNAAPYSPAELFVGENLFFAESDIVIRNPDPDSPVSGLWFATHSGHNFVIQRNTFMVFEDLGAVEDGLAPSETVYAPVTTMTWEGETFSSMGLDTHAKNTNIDLWAVSETSSNSEKIQFRVAAIPEPSSSALITIGSVGLLLRRRR